MKCLHPLSLVLDGKRQFVPCGKCNFCLEARRAHWTFRIQMESKVATAAHFLTLTYSDENLPINDCGFPELRKRDVQLFMKRLRKMTPAKLRYYFVGEYGTKTQRPHYHAIMFNMSESLVAALPDAWPQGHVYVGSVTGASIHYVTKYHVNPIGADDGRAPPFALMSRRPGIGANYIATHTQWHRAGNRFYTQVHGVLGSLPRYYREKMFKDENGEWLVDLTELMKEFDERDIYLKEIERISKYHPDPTSHYIERRHHAHDNIKHKSNLRNKF